MKITKTKEVVKEQIEVSVGTYYFECSDGEYHKVELGETDENNITNYRYTYVSNFSDVFGIRVRENYTYDEEDLPYKFSAFIREISGKKLKKRNLNSKNKK